MEKRARFESRWLPYALVAPQIAVTAIFFFWPAGETIWQSLLLQDAFGAHTQFVWFDNFTDLFRNDDYLNSFRITVVFSTAVTVIGLTVSWGLLFAATTPIRQAYLNGMIPSSQRATILSFDSMMTSGGGVWAQPVLGRAADAWSYPASYVMSGGIALLALPFIALSRRENAPADLVAGPPAAEPRREVDQERQADDEPLEA